jgi:hypothetical protein
VREPVGLASYGCLPGALCGVSPTEPEKIAPDQKHEVITDGYGTFDATNTPRNRYVMTSDYLTTARTPNCKLVIAYLPSSRTITLDVLRLAGAATARSYDPSRGTYKAFWLTPRQSRQAFF